MNGKTKLKSEAGKPKLVVPPKLLMAIEKDKTLKDRLKRYNLPIKGTRQVDNMLSRDLMPGETVRVTLSSSVLISLHGSPPACTGYPCKSCGKGIPRFDGQAVAVKLAMAVSKKPASAFQQITSSYEEAILSMEKTCLVLSMCSEGC